MTTTARTMTCAQLGGACELPLRGTTADEVVHAQDRHLREAVAAGDTTHTAALEAMQGRWKHPVKGMGWYRQVKRDFAAQPED
jgi:predicted small metal-binding protein